MKSDIDIDIVREEDRSFSGCTLHVTCDLGTLGRVKLVTAKIRLMRPRFVIAIQYTDRSVDWGVFSPINLASLPLSRTSAFTVCKFDCGNRRAAAFRRRRS